MVTLEKLEAMYTEVCDAYNAAVAEGDEQFAEILDAAIAGLGNALALAHGDEDEYNDSMDGDHASALASAGWGTDEDYGFFGENEHY